MLNRLIHVNCVVVQQRLQTLRAAMAEHQDNHWILALDMSIFLNLKTAIHMVPAVQWKTHTCISPHGNRTACKVPYQILPMSRHALYIQEKGFLKIKPLVSQSTEVSHSRMRHTCCSFNYRTLHLQRKLQCKLMDVLQPFKRCQRLQIKKVCFYRHCVPIR